MKRFLLVRHGETTWNREGRIQGWAHASLNDAGRRQAHAVATHLAADAPDVTEIYASDLPRAVETVDIIREEAFPDVPVTVDEGWRERDFGVFQGYDSGSFFEEYPEYAVIERGHEAAARTPEKGESYLEFRNRILDQWATFTRKVTADEVVLVVHGGVIRVIVAAIEGLSMPEAIQEVQPDNAAVTEIAYDCGREEARVVDRNRNEHLGRRRV
ncbi:MAG: histidine phosphatase family protein [Halobacteriaceae archaeon]